MIRESGHYTAYVLSLAGLGLGVAIVVAALLMPRVVCGEGDEE